MAEAAGTEDAAPVEDEAVESDEIPPLAIVVQGIAIDDAEVSWVDAATGASWQLEDFNLQLSDLSPGESFPMRMSFSLTGDDLALNLASQMQTTLGLEENRFLFEDLAVDLEGSGAAWPGEEGAIALTFDALEANLDAQTLDLRGLVLEALGLDVRGNLAGRNLFSALALSGDIAIAEFDPEDLMETFDVALETADPAVLSRVAASAQLVYDSNRMMLEQMSLTLDDSTLTGSLGMQGETLSFDLAVDTLNADRYLPPAEEAPQEGEGSLDEVDLPLDFLRTLNANGRMEIGAFQFDGLSFSDVSLQLSAQNGRVRVRPAAGLYGGTYAGTIGIDVQQQNALLTLDQQLASVDVATLMRDYLELDTFTGTLGLDMNVSATGANMGEVMRELDGAVTFALTEGSWEGVDLWHLLRRARALTQQADAPAAPATPRTPFSRIAASGSIENAVLINEDFAANFDFMTLAGAGTVELLNDNMSFDVTATFADTELVRNDPLMADLIGDSLPLTVTGSLAAPTVRPDFSALVRAEAQEAIDERIEEEREDVRERLQDRLRGILDR
jgi:AsmA protein